MDDFHNNQLLDDLPTQNEVMHNNNEERVSNYNPPPIYDNNIPQEVIQNNNNNNDQTPTNYNPPPIYDNNIPQEVIQNNNSNNNNNNNNNTEQIPINYIPPPIYYNNNTPQEYTKPTEYIPSQYPPAPQQNPNNINGKLNWQDPLSQNINNYPPQINNSNSTTSNIYDNKISPYIPSPQPVEEKQIPEESNSEDSEDNDPVYQLQLLREKRRKLHENECCCEYCCDDCDLCCDTCCSKCDSCCNNSDLQGCLECCVVLCQCLAAVLSCLAICAN